MMPRTIHLLPDVERSLDRLVGTGRYGDVNDVIMHALAALEDQEAIREARERRFLAHVDEGLADIAAGRTVPAEDVFAELREIIREAEAKQAAE